ncbi:hypothetical protein CYMTET_21846 [Cymbomonas tetramitiformis]|uniref:Peptidylprolyl isomerase n=1 Tax=Cymbomonas tetramitiformis TaxID=36881 RepID=A0AAE0G1E0_9CHLO|nr:hypothetical protein CYMTET_21846 [Cymbomonas tetramitiformis]|eukprot:gene10102-11957_t
MKSVAVVFNLILSFFAYPTCFAYTIPVKVGDKTYHVNVENGQDPSVAAASLLQDIQGSLQEEIARQSSLRKLLLELDINLDGKAERLEFRKGDNFTQIVEGFVQTKGLSQEIAAKLQDEVTKRAKEKGAIPIFEQKVKVGNDVFLFQLFKDQNVEEAAMDFCTLHGLPADDVSAFIRDLRVEMVAKRVIPLAEFNFLVNGENLTLPLLVHDNVTETIAQFGEIHELSAEDLNDVKEQIEAQLSQEGIIPLVEYPITVDGKELPLAVYARETSKAAVSRFVRAFGLPADVAPRLEAEVQKRMIRNGHAPVAALPVTIGDTVKTLTIFNNRNLTQTIEVFGRSNGLRDDSLTKLESVVKQQLQTGGLLPLVEFNFEANGKSFSLPLFHSENVAEAVEKFAEQHALSRDLVPALQATLERELATQGVAPLAELTVQAYGRNLTLKVYEGDNIGQVVRAFVEIHSIPAEAVRPLEEAVLARLKPPPPQAAPGPAPLATLSVNIDGKRVPLHWFAGETEAAAVDKFLAEQKLSSELGQKLLPELHRKAVEKGAVPLTEFNITFSGSQLKLQLFAGQPTVATVEKFVHDNALPVEALEGLLAEVQRRLVGEGLAPVLQVPMAVGDKKVMLDLYKGQAVPEAVEAFRRAHAIGEDKTHLLLSIVEKWLADTGNVAP